MTPAPATAPATNCTALRGDDPCLPCSLAARGESLGATSRNVRRGDVLYGQGDPFRSLFAVRSGTFKILASTPAGREQVTGFRMTGEFLALDALAQSQHATTAIALEDSEVLAIPYAPGSLGGGRVLVDLMPRLLSREIVRDHRLMLLLGSGMHAAQRLASFLLNLSGRMRARGYSPTEFHLRMTRVDIGSYLGLNLETVSRTFTALQRQGLLQVEGRHVRALDLAGLARLFDLPGAASVRLAATLS